MGIFLDLCPLSTDRTSSRYQRDALAAASLFPTTASSSALASASSASRTIAPRRAAAMTTIDR